MLYPFSDSDMTPFVGGGVGYGGLDIDRADGSGLHVLGDVGFMVGRASNVHFRVDLRPFLTLFHLSNGKMAYGAQLTAGIGF